MHFIEPLESRIAPAATASFAAGILTIVGDNQNDVVAVSELATAGAYHVDGLEVGQATDFSGVLSIVVNLRDGTDAFTFHGLPGADTLLKKDLKITGKGALQVTVNANVNIGGIVSIDHGGGPMTPALTANVEGAGITIGQLVIRDGQGDSTLNFGDGARVIKGVLYEGGGGDGNDGAFFNGATIGTSITKVDLGDGSDQLSIVGSHVGGAVKFTASSDNPNFAIQSSSAVKGPITALFTGGGTTTTTLAGLLGSITITAGASQDGVTFGGASVFGNVTLKLGDGSNTVTHGSGEVSGNLSIAGGKDSTAVTIDAFSRIYGSVAVAAPLASSVSVNLSNANLGGKLSVIAGIGNDGVTAISSTVTGGVAATLGLGTNNVLIDTLSSFAGITVNAGSGDDTLTAVNLAIRGALTAVLGDGLNTVNARGSVGGIKFTTGAGQDTIELRSLFARGATTIATGAGNDVIKVADGLFGGAFSVKAGDGNNTFNVEQLIADNDAVGTVFFGALSYVGGRDADTVVLGLDSDDRVITMAAAKFTGGTGVNTMDREFLTALSAVTVLGFTEI